ncbi:hypothetical protein OOU_Y34scaffold00217g13 [Pyricularia oryzae Y34]|uniref:Uncharacterized protein n=2 Tax=Pyricularia oryzae TaxID=318829 RepID=A0AA97PPG9_PYRO3|nr:hypothetical protein OOU_Y34scaffold00217g13 [Pyricularia oryzae Y34]
MAILATLETAPDFPAQHQIDVAACGSTTGSLIRFINSWGKMFRMLVEIVDDRVFLIRRERERERIPLRSLSRTYKASRTVRYRFGNLRFLVRFDGEGYRPGDDEPARARRTENHVGNQTNSHISAHDLAESMRRASVSVETEVDRDVIKIQKSGALVAQDMVLDLKTRSKNKDQLDKMMDAELQRLWVSRVQNIYPGHSQRWLVQRHSTHGRQG